MRFFLCCCDKNAIDVSICDGWFSDSDIRFCKIPVYKFSDLFADLKTSFIRNGFDILPQQVKGSGDLLMLWETKLGDDFQVNQFLIDGFQSPFSFSWDTNGGLILLYIRKDIPVRLVTNDHPTTEIF